ncbi:UDP-N-acetylglucosamine 1-carboxyvinyltransferase [bacterium SM23_31]|nr:MAG: UDP-N-acetylglucosamine 1-carboxyvinyltransferase [bacterium SM23_31]
MDKFIINGGKPLEGTVYIGGAKNAVLPAIAASLLASGISTISNAPQLRDVSTMCHLLRSLGAQIVFKDGVLTIDTANVNSFEAPYDIVKTMRASVYVLGPLIARFGKVLVSLPGGCAWGPRPIDLHLFGIKKLGAAISLDKGYINAAADTLHGAEIAFAKSSVGATGNVLMAAVTAKGKTVIRNAAVEPEITSLTENLVKMGAHIEGIGTSSLKISGVTSLEPLHTTVIPDRIEAGTFMAAGAIAGGKIILKNAEPSHLSAVIEKMRAAGISVKVGEEIIVESDGNILPADVLTDIYPGFPTDLQAQWIALMSVAKGNTVVEDTIFFDRFTHVAELNRLGADINVEANKAYIKGVDELKGAHVMSTDLRASASLILAGLRAKNQTEVHRIYHIDRGYESIEKKLQALGASIRRAPE